MQANKKKDKKYYSSRNSLKKTSLRDSIFSYKMLLLIIITIAVSYLFIIQENIVLYVSYIVTPIILSYIIWYMNKSMRILFPSVVDYIKNIISALIYSALSYALAFGLLYIDCCSFIKIIFIVLGSYFYSLSLLKMYFFMKKPIRNNKHKRTS